MQNTIGKRAATALIAVLGFLALSAQGCGAKVTDGHEVKSIGKPWVDDGPGGTVPNGCPGDGKTWAIVYYTIKNGERVQVFDAKANRNVDVVNTDCVLEARAVGLKVGGPYVR